MPLRTYYYGSSLIVYRPAFGSDGVLAATATANPSGNNSSLPSQDDSQNQSKADANQRIQSSIQGLLSDDPVLDGVDVQASVNDESIILTGTVASYAQHQR